MLVPKKSVKIQDRISLKDSTRSYTPEGYLTVRAHIARTGIQEYLGRELPGMGLEPDRTYKIYRPAKEVFAKRTLDSFARKPVTNEHPYDTGGVVDSKTATKKLVGVSGDDIRRDGTKILADLTIYDELVIEDIEAGKVGLSAGYRCSLDMTPGKTPEGEDFDGTQTDIEGNHTAVCDTDAARGGQVCRILDKKNARKKKRLNDMRRNAAYADDDDNNVPDLSDINQIGQMVIAQGKMIKEGFQSIAQALAGKKSAQEDDEIPDGDDESDEDTMQDDDSEVDAPDAEDNDLTGENTVDDEDEDTGEVPPAKTKKDGDKPPMKKNVKTGDTHKPVKANDSNAISAMQKRIAFLEGRLEATTKTVEKAKKATLDSNQIQHVVGARVKLLRDAEKVLPGVALDSLNELAIKKKVITQIYPNVALDKKSPEHISGMYEVAVQTFMEGSNSSVKLGAALIDSHVNQASFDEDLSLLDSGGLSEAARDDFCNRSRQAYKKGLHAKGNK